jgi:protein-S-isoprenylcysteine O-methyltransferase Ste14
VYARRACPERVHGSRWLLVGYGGIAGFFALEALTRASGPSSSLDASEEDRGTTRLVAASSALAALLTPAVQRIPAPELPGRYAVAGLSLQGVGLGLRAWSMQTLGRSYSRTLRTEEGQRVIDTGPYRYVRHPGYAGSLLIWLGFALTSRRLPVLVFVGTLMGSAYRRRIAGEEDLLRRALPSYDEYRTRTKKLIPLVW